MDQTLSHSQGITQTFKFCDKFHLKGQDQGHHFSNPSEKTFRCSINSSSWKVKFEMIQFLAVKIRILKAEGQFYLEDQGQGQQFSKSYEIFDDQ